MESAKTLPLNSLYTSPNLPTMSPDGSLRRHLRHRKANVQSIHSENSELSTADNSPMPVLKKHFDVPVSKSINESIHVNPPYPQDLKQFCFRATHSPSRLGVSPLAPDTEKSTPGHDSRDSLVAYHLKTLSPLAKDHSWIVEHFSRPSDPANPYSCDGRAAEHPRPFFGRDVDTSLSERFDFSRLAPSALHGPTHEEESGGVEEFSRESHVNLCDPYKKKPLRHKRVDVNFPTALDKAPHNSTSIPMVIPSPNTELHDPPSCCIPPPSSPSCCGLSSLPLASFPVTLVLTDSSTSLPMRKSGHPSYLGGTTYKRKPCHWREPCPVDFRSTPEPSNAKDEKPQEHQVPYSPYSETMQLKKLCLLQRTARRLQHQQQQHQVNSNATTTMMMMMVNSRPLSETVKPKMRLSQQPSGMNGQSGLDEQASCQGSSLKKKTKIPPECLAMPKRNSPQMNPWSVYHEMGQRLSGEASWEGTRHSCKCTRSLPLCYSRLYDIHQGMVSFSESPLFGQCHQEGELRRWPIPEDAVISQNNSKRKVHRGLWYSRRLANIAFPVAVKFVEDANARDGHSIKREIECYLYVHQHLEQLKKDENLSRIEDAWPSAELFGYYINKQDPGQCVIITRKLSGPDLFDIIRQESSRYQQLSKMSQRSATINALTYQLYKLHWCALALKRVQQYAKLGIRHNDVKPDNIVLDSFISPEGKHILDVKIIDLGTASMYSAKEFTGGTSWYESPELKMLEHLSKRRTSLGAREKVPIGLSSDVWAAGLSVTEILLGRRVVDAMTQGGPSPLMYRGEEEGWELEPEAWVNRVRETLFCTHETFKTSTGGSSKLSKHSLPASLKHLKKTPPGSPSPQDPPPSPAVVYFPFCFHAARLIFDSLVRVNPSERATLQQGIEILQTCATMVSSRLGHILLRTPDPQGILPVLSPFTPHSFP